MIKVVLQGGIGEQLFQYAFGRILAERFCFQFDCTPILGFPNTRTTLSGRRIFAPPLTWRGVMARHHPSRIQVTKPELTIPPEGQLTLAGWFQESEYFAADIEKITTDWLTNPQNATQRRNPREICIVLSLAHRATLYRDVFINTSAPLLRDTVSTVELDQDSLVASVLSLPNIMTSKVFIITDAPNDDIFDRLTSISPTVVHLGEPADLHFASTFSRIAASLYPFDWWCIALSDASEIFGLPCRYASLPEYLDAEQEDFDHLIPKHKTVIFEW